MTPVPPKAVTSSALSQLDLLGVTEPYAPLVPLPSAGLGKSAESGLKGGESQPASQPALCLGGERLFWEQVRDGMLCLFAPRDYQRWWSPALLSWTPSELQPWDCMGQEMDCYSARQPEAT